MRLGHFRRMRSLQKFAAVHASIYNLFNSGRNLHSRPNFKLNRDAAPAKWRGLGTAQRTVPPSLWRPLVLIRLTAPAEPNRRSRRVAPALFGIGSGICSQTETCSNWSDTASVYTTLCPARQLQQHHPGGTILARQNRLPNRLLVLDKCVGQHRRGR
jgi:hypothetical protein